MKYYPPKKPAGRELAAMKELYRAPTALERWVDAVMADIERMADSELVCGRHRMTCDAIDIRRLLEKHARRLLGNEQ